MREFVDFGGSNSFWGLKAAIVGDIVCISVHVRKVDKLKSVVSTLNLPHKHRKASFWT